METPNVTIQSTTPPPARHRTLKIVLLVLGILALIGSFFMNLVLGAIAVSGIAGVDGRDLREITLSDDTSALETNKIAVVNITGEISGGGSVIPGLAGNNPTSDDILKQLDHAQNDRDVKAVVLFVDSPGGEVIASEDLNDKIALVDKDKPVVTYINGSGTSGAYLAAVASRYIVANPASINGSIGVILQSYDVSGLMEKYGVRVNTFASGPMKNLLGFDHQPTPEEKAIVQGLIDDNFSIFVDRVVQGRGLDEVIVRKLADGRIYTAKQALDNKLIDAIGLRDDAYAKAAEIAGIQRYALVTYQTPHAFLSDLGLSNLFAGNDILATLKKIPTLSTRVMFL